MYIISKVCCLVLVQLAQNQSARTSRFLTESFVCVCSAGEKIHDNKAAVVGYPHVSVIIKKNSSGLAAAAILLSFAWCINRV